jgi:hypothetical protein
MSDYTDISDQILDGTLDNVLDSLIEDIKVRRQVLATKRARQAENLREGTRVMLVGVSPKKAEGATGTITYDTHNGKIGIVLDYSITNRLRGGSAYTWPASCYVAIDED